MRRSIAASAVVAVMGGLMGISPAQASNVGGGDQHVVLTERPGERNDVYVNWGNNSGASLVVRDYAGVHGISGPCLRFLGSTYDAQCVTPGRPRVTLNLGTGNDEARSGNLMARGTSTTMHGGTGNDYLESGEGADRLNGGPGNDTLVPDSDSPGPGDFLSGGSGTDLLDLRPVVASEIRASLDNLANDGRRGDHDNYRADIENVTGSNRGRNIIVGNNKKNTLTGGQHADHITGHGGKDRLVGGYGNDTINALDGRGGDRVSCGGDADVAYLDAGDVVAKGCEKRVFAAKMTRVRYVKKRNRVVARVSCPKQATTHCKGTVRLVRSGKVLLSRSYTVKRGKAKTISLKPNARGRKALRSKKKVAVQMVVSPRGVKAPVGKKVKIPRR